MDKPQMISRDNISFEHPSFPLVISSSVGVNPGFERLHWHDALEVNHIRQGSGFYLINGHKLEFQEGDLILINSDDLHRAFESDNLVMDILMFDPSILAVDLRYDPELMRPFREMGESFSNLVSREHGVHEELRKLFVRMMKEFEAKQDSYLSIIRSDLVRFLALTNRHLMLPNPTHNLLKQRNMHVLKEVIHTMETSLAYPWTLQELADLAHLSPSRFSTLFTQAVGTSPLNYLIQLRLTAAIHLLDKSNDKIIMIADQCGFRNLSNFNRLFKQYVGVSPSEYRMKD
ncbi:AraC family transcriptional regulator [Paenibacillus aquistagni]|uniref:AraC-like ligand binding domain-containing protein n=1 Tax=Paenibacillus aquistagni TaxID=1852522 RepID=A0A1X7LIY8_9BACL|nr:AraC family transcriptional regulator [Paenibacillus aquistagni]SMG53821.1 AraC-like ligand binding domain-containing protein [Paenibacillus aquistagni]